MRPRLTRSPLRPIVALALWGVVLAAAAPGLAAEAEMVGLLAVAIEPEVATELGLSPEQVEKLQDLADDREMAGLSQAMKMTGLGRDERIERFAPFRAESERLAFEVLSQRQRRRLEAVRAERADPALRSADPVDDSTPDATAPDATATDSPVDSTEPAPAPATEPAPSSEATPDEEAVPTSEADRVVPTAPVAAPDDGKLSFNFRKQPWSDVLDWFADRAGLSLVVDTAPPGTLNYRDARRYTPAEALDVLNGVLLTKGYTLVRKDRMLLVINLEDDVVPPNVVTDVPLDEMDRRGEYELIRVLLPIERADPERAAEALQRLVGPQGAIVVLSEARLLQVTETAGRIRTMARVLRAMEANASPDSAVEAAAELRTYPTAGADPASTLNVLQTLLAGSSTARLAVDEQTGRLIALATPAEHAAVAAALGKLQQDGRRVERIPVRVIDPLAAAAMVDRLFNPGTKAGDDAKPDPTAPIVEADREGGALLVRGNAGQVEQIRSLVEQIDAAPLADGLLSGGTVRTLPLTGPAARMTLEQVERLWPALRGNPLRVATPGGAIPSYRPGASVEQEEYWREAPIAPEPADAPAERDDTAERNTTARNKTARGATRRTFRFASETTAPDPANGAEPAGGPSPVLISPGSGGTVIASRDTEALDVLEQLIATISDQSGSGGRQYAVFYLKFADAATAAALLEGVFGGGDSGGGGLMGDLVGGAIGGAGGDLVGDLLGMGGGSSTGGFASISVDIVPDLRLNALLVNASPKDLETVNQLLRVIDQPQGPDRIEAAGRPRAIRIINAEVADVASVVRQVFQDRLQSSGGAGGGQPSPEDLFRMLREGGDGGKQQEQEKMTLGIDERSNSLIVRSSLPLFDEVQALVDILDREGVEDPVATRVVSLRNTSSDALRQTLGSLLGDKAQIGTGTGESAAPAGPNNTAGQRGRNNDEDAARQTRDAMRQIERFRRMQQMFRQGGGRGQGGRGQGGRGGGRPGGGGGGPGGRGGPGR